MATVTIKQAKMQLSKLINRAEAGEEIIIARGKKPVVRLTPVPTHRRRFGSMKGIWPDVPDAFFFDPLPEDELRLWEGWEGEEGELSPR
jgi:prevent-host-death family protein